MIFDDVRDGTGRGPDVRKIATRAIMYLGRYAMLPVVAVALAASAAWLTAFDHFPLAALVALPIFLALLTCTIALTIGMLLPIRRPNTGVIARYEDAPGLWRFWTELDPTTPVARRALTIDADFGASISEQRRNFGLFGRRITLTIGLPLLFVLDEPAVRAVVAHEVAHARLRHTSGSANLVEFQAATANLFAYADPDNTISGWIARLLLHSLLKWVGAEYLRLSRINELQAERAAADLVGVDEMGRARLLVAAAGTRLKDVIFTPLERELVGAIRAPKPPLLRMWDELPVILDSHGIAAAISARMSAKEDANATHPPLRSFLEHLGFSELPEIEMPRSSAVTSLMAAATFERLLKRFDDQWAGRVDRVIGIH